jgi:hypothetical protein
MRSNPSELSVTTTPRRLALGHPRLPYHADSPDVTISHLKSHRLGRFPDQTLATVLTICERMKQSGNGVKTAVEPYGHAVRRNPVSPISTDRIVRTEIGGLPPTEEHRRVGTLAKGLEGAPGVHFNPVDIESIESTRIGRGEGFEPATPWSRTRFHSLLKSIKTC